MKIFTKTLCMSVLTSLLVAGEYGIVNFATCLAESKKGKQEQVSFDALKKQITSMMEETEKQLNELSQKLNDSEYMDGLSPEAENELKNKFGMLSEEMNRYQGQYYQVMQQANMRIMQQVGQEASVAAEKVAKDKKLFMVINKDACFYYSADFDITQAVIAEMDKRFEVASKPATSEPAK
jgi:outer membrane protein